MPTGKFTRADLDSGRVVVRAVGKEFNADSTSLTASINIADPNLSEEVSITGIELGPTPTEPNAAIRRATVDGGKAVVRVVGSNFASATLDISVTITDPNNPGDTITLQTQIEDVNA